MLTLENEMFKAITVCILSQQDKMWLSKGRKIARNNQVGESKPYSSVESGESHLVIFVPGRLRLVQGQSGLRSKTKSQTNKQTKTTVCKSVSQLMECLMVWNKVMGSVPSTM